MVVEDTSAAILDTNNGRGWGILVHEASGRPTAAGLNALAADQAYRDTRLAHAAAKQLAQLYPASAQSWSSLQFYAKLDLGPAGEDSLKEKQKQKLLELDRRLSQQDTVSAEDASGMFFFASSIGDTAVAGYWRRRLIKEHPKDPQAVQLRVAFDIVNANKGDHAKSLSAAEALWAEVGPAHPLLLQVGLNAAERTRDPSAVSRWVDRHTSVTITTRVALASRLLKLPDSRREGIITIRHLLRQLDTPPDAERGLFMTHEAFHAQMLLTRKTAFAEIGKALVADGNIRGGLDTLRLAADGTWDTTLLQDAASASLLAGDTTGAIAYWAKLLSDPVSRSSFPDSLRTFASNQAGHSEWERLVSAAVAEHRRYVLNSSIDRPLPVVRVMDGAGRKLLLSDLVKGNTTVVVLWSRFCGAAVAALPDITNLANATATFGAKILMVTEEAPSSAAAEWFRVQEVRTPVYYDAWNDAFRMSNGGTPEYYVVDTAGEIRFATYGTTRPIQAQLDALTAKSK